MPSVYKDALIDFSQPVLFQDFNPNPVFAYMASSSSSHQHSAFSGIEPDLKRRKVSESSRIYDVFINHRGPDVKNTLALQLYNSLQDLKIRAFLDSEEKELRHSFPSTIETAIRSALVHVAIFSKRYAESAWCLAELVLMLQSKAMIIPVFYDVEPSALRHIEKGVYAHAFIQYREKSRYLEKLEEWKEAIQSISFIAGEELNSSSDCKNIVSAVQKEVQRKKSLIVAKYPVGLPKLVEHFEKQCIDKLVKDFERQCGMNKQREGRANVVGIFGMGGVGKTTLSKELFNRKRSDYSRSCFLFDVREASVKSNLPSLQMKLLRDLFDEDHRSFSSVEDGTNSLSDSIQRSNLLSFLIVLDDIDHLEQLDALLIRDVLNKPGNSLVIVTTRDVGVLVSAGITVGYYLKGLDTHDAKELFCWHAFCQSYPSSGYEQLVDRFVHVCGGLPLSLQVLGSHVHGTDQNFWELELKKVSKTLPRDIHKRLKISIDSLDNEEKQIFMDIACFFIGKLKSHAISVWKASGWSAQHALQRLKNKCLVEETEERNFKDPFGDLFESSREKNSVFRMHGRLGAGHRLKSKRLVEEIEEQNFKDPFGDLFDSSREKNSVLRMHDHLRDLGREIAELSHPRRLWRSHYSEEIADDLSYPCRLRQSESTQRLWHSEHRQSLISERFEKILTQTKGRCLRSFRDPFGSFNIRYFLGESDNMAETSTSLLWLELSYYGQTFPNIPPWIPLQNLQYLGIFGGYLERLWQNNVQVPYLVKELHIGMIEMLEELSLGLLRCLERIIISNCQHLKSVTGMSDLTTLVELNIHKCSEIEELSFVHGSWVKMIRISDCPNLKNVVEMSGLRKLVELSIQKCSILEGLSFVQVGCLEKIRISDCAYLKNVAGMSDLRKLVELNIHKCSNLGELSFVHGSWVKKIRISDCPNLKNVAGMSDLRKLVELNIHKCLNLEELRFVQVNCLEKISISYCPLLKNVAGMSDLRKLVELNIQQCSNLEELCSVQVSCPEKKRISDCPYLQNVEGRSDLRKPVELNIHKGSSVQVCCLETIRIYDCQRLKSLAGICGARKLVLLNIGKCTNLEDEELCFLGQSCLEKFIISDFPNLKCLKGTSYLTKLVEMQIKQCPKLEELSLFQLTCLEKITIFDCPNLQSMTLSHLKKLLELNIEFCEKIEELSLVQLNCLERLVTSCCLMLKNIEVKGCKSLRIVNIENVVKLNICDCPELEYLPELGNLRQLKMVSLDKCPKLKKIPLLTTHIKLTLQCCRELQTVTGICDLMDFQDLFISGCPEFEFDELSYGRLTWLKIIAADGCGKMQQITGIEKLRSLERMQFLYCANETIWNYILKMEKLPSDFFQVIGRAVDGAESNLNPSFFCDGNLSATANSVIQIGTNNICNEDLVSAIILCAVVVVNTSTGAKMINDFIKGCDWNPWVKFDVRQGEWIITLVTTNEDEGHSYILNKGYCFPFDYVFTDGAVTEDVIVNKGYKATMKKGEEHKILNVLHRIVDKLYQK